MELIDVVMQLNGPILPVGDSHVDGARLENLTALCALTSELLDRIEVVAQCYGGHMASVKAAKDRATAFLIDASARAVTPAEPPAVEAARSKLQERALSLHDSGLSWEQADACALQEAGIGSAAIRELVGESGVVVSDTGLTILTVSEVYQFARHCLVHAQSAAVEAAPMVKE